MPNLFFWWQHGMKYKKRYEVVVKGQALGDHMAVGIKHCGNTSDYKNCNHITYWDSSRDHPKVQIEIKNY